MKKPNFFIIGAPKCGTTSLAAWLSEHPNIYMTPIKEPLYYCCDFRVKYRVPRNRFEYEQLFWAASEKHMAVGEASVWYLYSKVAIPNIEREHPGARYIVMVRNPVEMAYSLHDELTYWGHEHIKQFDKAWRLSPERRVGRKITRRCQVPPQWLDYQKVCLLGDQLERLFRLVPRERVLIIVLDDLKKDPRAEYQRVLEFLGVPDDGRRDFPVYNPAREARWPVLQRAIRLVGNPIGTISLGVKRVFGVPIYKNLGILSPVFKQIERINTKCRPRPPMPEELRRELIEYFRSDIKKLSELINRDLSGWLK